MSVAEHKRGGPKGTRSESAIKRAKIIELRMTGHSLEAIGEKLDLSHEGVRYHELAWLASQTPTAEVTEERRQVQLAAIDAVRRRLFAALDDASGEPRLDVVDRIEKLWAREARLVGLDLTTSSITVNVTAEGLAAALGFDDAVVDVEAVEQPALEAGTE